jgi:hypothetical protein
MFNPYKYRTSRDIRNQLCIYFLEALHDGNRPRFNTRSAALKQKAPDAPHQDFINGRIRRYKSIFHTLNISEAPAQDAANFPADPMAVAAFLFSSKLFYECHEWLEESWRPAKGPKKKALQALIRTTGAFALCEAGRTTPAKSSAQKALALLEEFQDHVPAPFDPDELRSALQQLIRSDTP